MGNELKKTTDSLHQELKIAGNRPSGYIKVRLGADEKGVVQVWDSHHWGTSGHNGGTVQQTTVPYVFSPPNYRRRSRRNSNASYKKYVWGWVYLRR